MKTNIKIYSLLLFSMLLQFNLLFAQSDDCCCEDDGSGDQTGCLGMQIELNDINYIILPDGALDITITDDQPPYTLFSDIGFTETNDYGFFFLDPFVASVDFSITNGIGCKFLKPATPPLGCCYRCEGNQPVFNENYTKQQCIDDPEYIWVDIPCDQLGNPCNGVFGCTDPNACNYNPDATVDDGSCILLPVCNDDPCLGDVEVLDLANCICVVIEQQVLGCADSAASNYNPDANCNDGSCNFDGCCICCEDGEITYNGSNNQTDCEAQPGFTWVAVECAQVPGAFICPMPGCTDPNACNYNSDATIEDGTCDYSCQCFPSLQLSGNIPSSEYHSSTIIQSTAIIDSGKTVELYAPDCIHLDSGTSIKASSTFKARIEDCEE